MKNLRVAGRAVQIGTYCGQNDILRWMIKARKLVAALALVAASIASVNPSVASTPPDPGSSTPNANGAVPPPGSRPFASLPHLGAAPQPCFPYGSSDNICTGPSWPYPPNANYLYATYYGTVYISPHVVDVGQDITARAVSRLNGVPGWNAPPGPIVAGCRGQESDSAGKVVRAADLFCTWKATVASPYPPDTSAPGHGWDEYGMSFCGFFGCAESSDFYYVLPHKRAISGIVTTTGQNLKSKGATEILPIANAVVHISGPQNGTAVTDASGFYDAVVDPGTYSVSAIADINGGQMTATPTNCASVSSHGSSCTVSTEGGDAAANFVAGCGDQVSPFDTGATNARAANTEAVPDGEVVLVTAGLFDHVVTCPLYIEVTQGDTTAQSPFNMVSGASILPAGTAEIGFKVPTDFQGGATFKGQCVSGCTDLLATVSLSANLNNAGEVTSLGAPLAGARSRPRLWASPRKTRSSTPDAGNGTLCVASSFGSEVQGGPRAGPKVMAETDGAGQVRLRYWGPASWQMYGSDGLPLAPPKATIRFTAIAHDCNTSACTVQQTDKPVDVKAHINPHVESTRGPPSSPTSN